MLQVSVQTAVECEYLNTESRICDCSTVCVTILATCFKNEEGQQILFVYGLTTLSVTQNMQYQMVEESVKDKFETVWKEAAMPLSEVQ